MTASDQPASEQTLKHMLLFLQKDLRNELCSSISSLQSRIDQVEEHTDILERQATDHAAIYYEVTEAYHQHSEEIGFLQAKVADLEDHYRRKNIKFRGIPEIMKTSRSDSICTTTVTCAFSS